MEATCDTCGPRTVGATEFNRGVCGACRKREQDAIKAAARSAGSKRTQFKKQLPPVKCGQRFGAWVALSDERRVGAYYVVDVVCDCGAHSCVAVDTLHKGSSTSCRKCGRMRAATARKAYYNYADVCPDEDLRRRLLSRIAACLNRCHNPKDKGFASYGGRGISVHEPWRTDRKSFLAHLMTLPGVYDAKRLELDRTDVQGNYAPGNLRFVTRAENARNKRKPNDLSARIRELEQKIKELERG